MPKPGVPDDSQTVVGGSGEGPAGWNAEKERSMRDKELAPATSPEPRYDILCIFTPTGHTFTFRNVGVVCDNETMLIFKYGAVSDGLSKTATFPKATLCGWSVTLGPKPNQQ